MPAAVATTSLQPPTLTPTCHSPGSFWSPGVQLFRALRFRAKMLLVAAVVVLPLMALVAGQMVQQSNTDMQSRRDAIRQHVEIASGVLRWAYDQEQSGKLTRAQAQDAALQAVATLRYDKSEYFWISDVGNRILMHAANPKLNGQDGASVKDADGRPLFAMFNQATAQRGGAGFVTYGWQGKPSEPVAQKLAYVARFEQWGWVLGTGLYVDDLRKTVVEQAKINATVLVLATALMAYFLWCFFLAVDSGLQQLGSHLRAMRDGDLTRTPEPVGRDEVAQLVGDCKDMQLALRAMVGRVTASSEDVESAAGEVANGAHNLSSRTEQASASLVQTAASMEQITATIKNTSDHTDQASAMARHNAEIAATGARVMGDVAETMQRIRASSTRIADIIGTIDGIAFQTNILALNAAVEAARAGEQGRGFAVVAGEVRSLAQRSATAAHEIRDLIGGSVEQVVEGNAIVERAASTIADIVQASQHVNALLGEIANGARQQSQGIVQIGQAVQELDRATQENAALVEQTAAAATAMRDDARDMLAEVSRYRLL